MKIIAVAIAISRTTYNDFFWFFLDLFFCFAELYSQAHAYSMISILIDQQAQIDNINMN